MKKLFLVLILVLPIFATDTYSYRKYLHVKQFYEEITPQALDISLQYRLPPAALLAIAGLESGYGRGYVARITGNILSLGAFKSDHELPSVYLPWCSIHQQILIDPKEIEKHPKNALDFKHRPKSLKKDYRPKPYAGTCKNLEYFKYHPKERKEAHYRCLQDFATKWITLSSNKKVFADTRRWLDKLVKQHGEKVLFEKSTNIAFINRIGGHPDSFNYRKSWNTKALQIMNKTGLVKLCQEIHFHKRTFADTWKEQPVHLAKSIH